MQFITRITSLAAQGLKEIALEFILESLEEVRCEPADLTVVKPGPAAGSYSHV